jgi:hypothetical protein
MNHKIILKFLAVTLLGAFLIFNANPNVFKKENDSKLSNLLALTEANAEGGTSGSWDCYASTNNCLFWGCWTVYKCGNPCTSVSCDGANDKGKCTAVN